MYLSFLHYWNRQINLSILLVDFELTLIYSNTEERRIKAKETSEEQKY